MKLHFLSRLLLVIGLFAKHDSLADALEKLFQNPPTAARPHVMWMWMGCNITKASITKDLEALHDAGFGGTLMFSCADTTTPWPGEIGKSPTPEVVAFTEPWWQLVRHTALESRRLGMDFGMASSPGYSTSGGPWITPELSMSQICFTNIAVTGPGKAKLDLPQPTVDPRGDMKFPVFNPETGKVEKPMITARKTFYRDIAVIALPASGIAARNQVIDLTGKTEWDVPAGEWRIYRFGYTTKGILLQPPQWQAQGLECDKLNPEAVSFHLDHVIGEIQKHVGDLVGKGFNFVHLDSYEAGVPEWTPKMREEFRQRRGYDLTPFLATLAGKTIGSKAETEKFRADFKETVRDLFRDVYYRTFREKLKAAGLVFASEPYGGEWRQDDVVPQVDRLLVEFWTHKDGFGAPTIAAQQRTGRNLVEAEAFTGCPDYSKWSEYPGWIKPIGDKAFCAGINRLVLHRVVPQPWDDKYKPGNTMGWWGTHFDRTQTWWEHGKAMVQYWTRCQALLQWGKVVVAKGDFAVLTKTGAVNVSAIHRRGKGADIWFVANTTNAAGSARCRFAVTGKQPELWDAVTGEMRALPDFAMTASNTVVNLEFAPGQSCFVVFRHPAKAVKGGENFAAQVPVATLDGAWQVQFDPQWGGPTNPVVFETLDDWTKRMEPGIKYFSGTAIYRKTFDVDVQKHLLLDLGVVKHTAKVRLNGHDLGVVWTAPWQVKVPDGLLRERGNQLEIEVANVWANRLIGDEQEPADCEWIPGARGNGGSLKEFPDWFLKSEPRPSKGRYCFTTWNYFTKDSPLVPSGLIGPVRILHADFRNGGLAMLPAVRTNELLPALPKPGFAPLVVVDDSRHADPLMVTATNSGNNQLLYFTTPSLTADDRHLVFISDRTGDPNLFTRDLVTGVECQLTTNTEGVLKSYVYFDGTPYRGLGKGSVSLDPQSGTVYYIQGREIRTVRLNGKTRVLAVLPTNQMTAFTHVSADGRRLCVPTTDARALDDDKIFRGKPPYDVDQRIQQEGLSSYIRVFDTKTGEQMFCERVPKAWVTHVQFSPVDPNLILYNHEWCSESGVRRMWLWDGTNHIRLRTEGAGRHRDDWTCHEMWERDGSAIIYHGNFTNGVSYIGRVSSNGLSRVEIPLPKGWKHYGHFTVGKSGEMVTDGCYQEVADKKWAGAWISLLHVDWEQGCIRWFPLTKHGSTWRSQDEHPHPVFNHAGDAVWFTSDKSGHRAVYRQNL